MEMEDDKREEETEEVEKEKEEAFYTDGAKYWSGIEANVEGMLGGLGYLTKIDIQSSERFLRALRKLPNPFGTTYALDCGAGIGRITKHLLTNNFAKVDLVDQDEKFIEEAKNNLKDNPKVGDFFCSGLHKFTPEKEKYDVIWVQWVLMHLNDEDLKKFLGRCCSALKLNGMIIIKENCTSSGTEVETDTNDSSMTRPFSHFMTIFEFCDLKVVKYTKQKQFPSELYPVWTFALKPKDKD